MRVTQESVLAEMRRWGYRHVVTPVLESLDVLSRGLGRDELRRLFKLTDQDGSLLAVVGERTIPVARLAAGKLRSAPLPLRLCYAGPVLSYEGGRFTRRRESYQAGAELMGAAGPVADAEVIALAARCLEAAGLRRWQVDVGHAGFFRGVLEGLDVSDETRSGIHATLAARDFVSLERILDATTLRSAEHELLRRFPTLRGGPEILDVAGELVQSRRAEQALEQLAVVHALLRTHGLDDTINLDLGAIRDFDYYTGVIFEGYGEDLGRPLAQGGRYDRLLERFGRPAPATGLVLNLDLVGEALRRSESGPELTRLDAALAWTGGGLEHALRLGLTLRTFGIRAVVDTEQRDQGAASTWADGLGARNLVHLDGGLEASWTPAGGDPRRLPVDQVPAELSRGAWS